jgi:hypothetical protein
MKSHINRNIRNIRGINKSSLNGSRMGGAATTLLGNQSTKNYRLNQTVVDD